ncbi:MAG: patatin-like phospholipase family protein [Acidimicrobiales bacterium]
MSVALVLPGGANFGAIQVGMLKALARAGVQPDLLVGTSIGAVNATYLGLHGGLAGLPGLEQIWLGTTRRVTFPIRPDVMALGLANRGRGMVPGSAPRRFMTSIYGTRNLEDASPRVAVVTTDATTGEDVLLTSGPATPAVVASTAMPGIFPPVRIGGRWLCDGSVSADMGVLQAESLGATVIYVLSTRPPTTGREPPNGAFAMVMRAASLLEDRLNDHVLAEVGARRDVRVIPAAELGVDLLPYDFRRTAQLIALGEVTATAWLGSAA